MQELNRPSPTLGLSREGSREGREGPAAAAACRQCDGGTRRTSAARAPGCCTGHGPPCRRSSVRSKPEVGGGPGLWVIGPSSSGPPLLSGGPRGGSQPERRLGKLPVALSSFPALGPGGSGDCRPGMTRPTGNLNITVRQWQQGHARPWAAGPLPAQVNRARGARGPLTLRGADDEGRGLRGTTNNGKAI